MMANSGNSRVLIIEDTDKKWRDIKKVLQRVPAMTSIRATTIEEAEQLIEEGWDLLILDISMNIRSSTAGPKQGGHDPIGGLKVAAKMFYLGCEVPTIIVTAFDAFPARQRGGDDNLILGLKEVEERAAKLLGDAFVGCIKWGGPAWDTQLHGRICEVLKK